MGKKRSLPPLCRNYDRIENVCASVTSTNSRQTSIQAFFHVAKTKTRPSNRKMESIHSTSAFHDSGDRHDENCNFTANVVSHEAVLRHKTPTSSELYADGSTKSSSIKESKANKQLLQLYLDLGQRDFAKQKFCSTCGMMYVHGVKEDIKDHDRICKDYTLGVPFHIESARLVACPRKDAAIYEIRPSDSQVLRNKVQQVRVIVDNELGFVSSSKDPEFLTTFLYTLQKRVVGLCSALPIRRGYLLDSKNSERSRHAKKAMIGINQIWVHSKFRNQGIATALVDAVREKMVFGLVVPVTQVAFSSPTESGALFARRYVHLCSGASEILVYDLATSDD